MALVDKSHVPHSNTTRQMKLFLISGENTSTPLEYKCDTLSLRLRDTVNYRARADISRRNLSCLLSTLLLGIMTGCCITFYLFEN